MKKLKAIRLGISILSLMTILTLIILYNISSVELSMKNFMDSYGYTSVFLLSIITDVIMQPIGPDIVMTIAILLDMNEFIVTTLAIMGSSIASIFGYYVGKKYGEYGNYCKHKNYPKWRRMYTKYGKFSLTLGALTPVPYTPMCWIAGIFNMKLYHFILLGLVPRILRFITVAYLIHLFMMI